MRLCLVPPHSQIIALVLSFTTFALAEPPPGYELKWSDEFDGGKLDLQKWKHWLLGKRRDAVNTADAVSVADGKLTITTYTEGGQNYTGMVATEDKFERAFGYWEARIQWGDVPGTWSVFWTISQPMMLPHMGEHIGNVEKAGNEVDFVEHRGVDDEGKYMAGKANFTLHWDGYAEHRNGSGFLTENLKLDQGFHIYGCEWSEGGYRFFIDGKLLWETRGPVSKRPQFTILSTEVDDQSWAWHIPKEGYGDRASSKVKMVVDYVRIYAKPAR